MPAQNSLLVARGPDGVARVVEVDANGYLIVGATAAPVTDSNSADNITSADVIGNKTDVASEVVGTASLVALSRQLIVDLDDNLAETVEIERHLHNWGRGFGARPVPTATRFAEPLGVLAVAADPIWIRFTPGAVNVWGAWLQIWGPDDAAAILPADRNAFWDIHKIKLVDAADDKKNYILQLAADVVSPAAALIAGTYGEYPLFIEKGDKAPAPVTLLTNRVAAAYSMWGRVVTTDGDAGSWLDVQLEAHGYPFPG